MLTLIPSRSFLRDLEDKVIKQVKYTSSISSKGGVLVLSSVLLIIAGTPRVELVSVVPLGSSQGIQILSGNQSSLSLLDSPSSASKRQKRVACDCPNCRRSEGGVR